MIKKAYIILAHKAPEQLLRLVRALDDKRSNFFVHIDLAVNLGDFQKVADYGSSVIMLKRERTGWGSFGLVRATLNGLECVAASKVKFDRVTLLSGEDYPIKSNEEIDRFFETSAASIFMEYHLLPDFKKWKQGGGMYRVNKYFFGFSFPLKLAAKGMNLLASVFTSLQRKQVPAMKPYWGPQWWTIDLYCVEYILDFLEQNPAYIRFHKYTFAPDEIFFQAIVLNAEDEHIKKKLQNDCLRFMLWKDEDAAHPELLTTRELLQMFHSSSLFARKFNPEHAAEAAEVLDLIDLQRVGRSRSQERA